MRDRWDEEEEELGRGRGRRRDPEPEPEPTLGEVIDGAMRKLVTGIVIAGGLIGLGVYSSRGGDPSPDFQIATTPDGIVYRLSSESGRIIACQGGGRHCWQVLTRGQDLEEGPPAPETPKQNAGAPQPQAVTGQPAAQQLPAPQNTQAPAAR